MYIQQLYIFAFQLNTLHILALSSSHTEALSGPLGVNVMYQHAG